MLRTPLAFLALAVTAALTVAACDSSSAASTGGSGDSSQSGADTAVTLRIGNQNKQLEEPLDLSGQSKDTSYAAPWSNFIDGPHMDAAFSAGKIDVGFLGDSPALLATASGANAVVVGATKFEPNTNFVVVAKPGSGIKTLADLRGKKVAFTRATALQGYPLQSLATVGLTQNDITPINVPGASLGTTLGSGAADAAVFASFLLTNYLTQHPDAAVLSSPVTSYCVLLATRKALADPKKKAAVYDLVDRLTKAGQWVKSNADTYVQKYFVSFQHQDAVGAKASYDRTGPPLWIAPTDDLIAHQQDQGRLLVSVGVLPSGFNASSQFDAEITRQVTGTLQKTESS